jgi:hypothetical protein
MVFINFDVRILELCIIINALENHEYELIQL